MLNVTIIHVFLRYYFVIYFEREDLMVDLGTDGKILFGKLQINWQTDRREDGGEARLNLGCSAILID